MKTNFLTLGRMIGRLAWLLAELAWGGVTFLTTIALPNRGSSQARARWLQILCHRLLRVFQLKLEASGTPPGTGMLVCNHLSYLDIVVIGALSPAIFVAKSEVQNWPVLGWFARAGGTLFIQRGKRSDVARLRHEIDEVLQDGALVVIFPEGTSSDGRTVLPFKSSLLEPASRIDCPMTAACLRYELPGGDPQKEVAYWGDMTLGPHLLNLLGKESIRGHIQFSMRVIPNPDRKELARQLQAEVLNLHASRNLIYA